MINKIINSENKITTVVTLGDNDVLIGTTCNNVATISMSSIINEKPSYPEVVLICNTEHSIRVLLTQLNFCLQKFNDAKNKECKQ